MTDGHKTVDIVLANLHTRLFPAEGWSSETERSNAFWEAKDILFAMVKEKDAEIAELKKQKENIALFFDVLKRRKIDLNQFDESDHLNRRLAEFHNETIDTVIAQFRRVVREAGYTEDVEGGATI